MEEEMCECGKPAVGFFYGRSNVYAGLEEVEKPRCNVCKYHAQKAINKGYMVTAFK